MPYMPQVVARPDRYRVHADQYTHYQREGYLVVPSLLDQADVKKLHDWADGLYEGQIPVAGHDAYDPEMSAAEKSARVTRIHMLHRNQAVGEWGLLHPRVLDVVEALIGPDVLALQSMLFFNPPGLGGQGWHQDAYYITTYPETLIGAWIALEDVDIENGCLWVAPGSCNEPVYPDADPVQSVHATGAFDSLPPVLHASSMDDEANSLSKVAARYPAIIPVPMKAGDVLFFESHLLHRSYPNKTEDRFRRAYVCHYCNARSWVPWNHGEAFEGDSANYSHILARGQTHLPYAAPAFGTRVDLPVLEPGKPAAAKRMMAMPDGQMKGM
ncbi:phytanoyl-CoA dioxygenase family protein [Paenibacillus mendelii]|uniref:Phytanoyl-CoA dioxygenase family protein n=1 Tax=Paenibacillus mendelii TaxID=206163 RepID=A0ABV6JAV3_9BACL|nr:phytanoyl-CoA dioxygenase family protein [Paenibacillus mendelii]MCQ6562912.1 phytanoyl-CoA dioxygenase family protein [Paenibacillus mendelii]